MGYQHSRETAVLVALVLAVSITSLPAVEQTGEIRGSVRDEQGAPLAGIAVTVRGKNLQGERSATTDARGAFVFRTLPPGPYAVKYSAAGYDVIEQETVVGVGRATSLLVNLVAGGKAENVSVFGSIPLVDTVRTNTQANYDRDYLEKVQTGSGGRDYLSVIQNTAGTGPGDGGNPTVRGSTVAENLYLVDGVDSTDPVTATCGSNFIFDAIEEVQFQSGGFAAEFGRSTGGIVNVVTKSGGNEFAGSIDLRFRNQNFLTKGDHFDPGEFTQNRQLAEATLGGPVIKDKLWFFVAGSFNENEVQPAGSPTLSKFLGNYYLAKLTWQINSAHKLSFQATGDPATIDNIDSSPLVAREATSQQTQGSEFGSVHYQATFTSNLLLDAQVAKYRTGLDAEPQSGDFSTIGNFNLLTGELTGNAIDIQHSDRFRDQANATLTWHVPRAAGEHTFKFGIDVQDVKFGFDQSVPGGEADTIAPDANGVFIPVLYDEVISAGRVDNKGVVAGYFAQDEWRILPRLTLNAGLRLDAFRYDDDRGARVFDASLIEPRLGVAWNATGDAKNVFKAYWGIFAHPSLLALPRVVNTRANFQNTFLNEEIACWVVPDPNCPGRGPFPLDFDGDMVIDPRLLVFSAGGPGGTIFAHDGRLDPTNVVETALTYERQMSERTAVSLTLVDRKTRDIIEDTLDFTTFQYVIDNVAALKRRHTGAELRFTAAWKDFHLASSYSYGVSRGNIEDTQGLGTDFDFPIHRVNRYGNLSDDARHTVRANGYWSLPWTLELGYAYLFSTGFPQNLIRPTFPYGDEFIRPRGYLRNPAIQQLDVELRKNIPLRGTRLQVIATMLNLFDTEAVTATDSLDPQHQALGYQVPRRYELGVRYTF